MKNLISSKLFLVRSCTLINTISHRGFTVQKMKFFPLKITSVNVTQSAGNCGSGDIY